MNVEISVDSFLWLRQNGLEGDCWNEICKFCTHNNPDFIRNQRLGFPNFNKKTQVEVPRKIKTFAIEDGVGKFNRGNLPIIRGILRRHGHKVKILDNRLVLPSIEFKNNKIKLQNHQVEPVKAILAKQQGIVRGPCSAGKTILLLSAIAEAKQPALVVVWNTIHQKQWIKEATNSDLLGLNPSDIGGVGGVFKKPVLGKLNVCMQQSLWRESNLLFFKNSVGFVGADEIQRFAATTFQTTLNQFPAKYRVGVSANERRKDGKEFLIYSSLGKVINNIGNIKLGSRMESRIYLVPTKFHSELYSFNHSWTYLLNEIGEDKKRNAKIIFMVKRSLAKNKLCLVLTERVKHALVLFQKFQKEGYRVGLLIGNQSKKDVRDSDLGEDLKEILLNYEADYEFDRITRLAAKRKLDLIISTQKGDVGLNVKTIDHGFITTPTGNNIERFNQQKGRVERHHEGKLHPCVYYFWDVKNDRLRDGGNMIMKTFPQSSVLKVL